MESLYCSVSFPFIQILSFTKENSMFINELLEKDIIVIDATDTSNHTIKMETTVISLESEKDIKYMHSIEDKLQGFKYSIVQPLKNNNQLIN